MGGSKAEPKGVGEVANDLWQLVRDYAKQETIDPLKALKRFVTYGLGGAALLSLGLFFATLAVLRALQTETGDTFTGNFDFVPYVVAVLFAVVAIGLSVLAIKRPIRAEEKQR